MANLDQILCVASLGWGKGCIRFWGRLTLAHWTQVNDRCPLGYLLAHLSRRLTRWAYSIPMVCRPSSSIVVHTFKLEYLCSQLANLDQILCIASLGWGKDCIRFWGRLDKNSGFHGNRKPPIDLQWGKRCLHLFSVVFDLILFILAGNEDMHNISNSFEFRPDRTTVYGVSCPWASKKFPITYKRVSPAFIFDRIIIKVAGNQDRHKAWMSLILGRIRLLTLALLALEWRKFYFRTWISLRPVGQSWSNFMCRITGGGERLHNVMRQTGSNLWCPCPLDYLIVLFNAVKTDTKLTLHHMGKIFII